MKAEQVYLSLGSNIGSSCDTLLQAVVELDRAGLNIIRTSGIYLTEPVGFSAQPDFYNMVLEAKTTYNPRETLMICQEIETCLGRVRTMRWGPRTIDIDILFYDNLVIEEPDLKVPHPRLGERSFVLVPLREIAPSKFTDLGLSIPPQKVCLKITRLDVKILLSEHGLPLE